MTSHHLHLVSDATGETINSVARACLVQFEGVEPIEHVWSLVRTGGQMEKVLKGIEENPGAVLYTMVNHKLRNELIDGCRRVGVPCIPVLDPVMHTLANYFGVEMSGQPGLQHALDAEYFNRMEAMNFALAHDDGQLFSDLEAADIVVVGVSRTSKTPTCLYLANRGIKAANVPVVPGCPIPAELLQSRRPLVVGLTKDPESLVQIRKNRLRMIAEAEDQTDYVDLESVREEVSMARKLCTQQGWPLIDVTRRSIEETAATIMNHYTRYQEGLD
ncbi:MAG: pyruvate, water dikinase regulatory protein [Pseudomonadota bacterium]